MIITPGQLTRRANFYFQLASLLSAGVPVIQALEMTRGKSRDTYAWNIGVIINKERAQYS